MNNEKKPRKKKTCYCKYKIDDVVSEMKNLKQQFDYLKSNSIQTTLKIYSAENDICIGMNSSLWHRIICIYDGDKCLGPPRDHWESSWDIKEDGFHLKEFTQTVKYISTGWRGQYNPKNELKFDQLPHTIVNQHHKFLVEHIRKLGIWYPCAILNDSTGEVYRP